MKSVAQLVKNPPAMQDTWVQSLGQEDPPEKGTATHSSIPAWRTPWTVLSMGFSRQEYWSGLPCPSPGDLPDPGIEPRYPALQADSLPFEPPGKPLLESRCVFILYQVCVLKVFSPDCGLSFRSLLCLSPSRI